MKTADGTESFTDIRDDLCLETGAYLLESAAVDIVAGDDYYLVYRIFERGEQSLKEGLAVILEEILFAPSRTFCLAAGKDDSRLHSIIPFSVTPSASLYPRFPANLCSDSRGILSAAPRPRLRARVCRAYLQAPQYCRL